MYRMLQYVCCCLCISSLQAAWTTPETISATDKHVSAPQIAVDADGNATAVWRRRSDGTNFIIQAKTKPFGESWQVSPDDLSDPGGSADAPQIAVDAAGDATAVWIRSDGTSFIVQAKTKPFEESWQDLDNLSDPGRDAFVPQIAMDADGNATAVWQRYGGNNYIAQAKTKPFRESWQDLDTLSASGQDALEPQIAVDAAGNATAIWLGTNGTNYIVQAKTKPFGESWQENPDNLSAAGQDVYMPQIAVDAAGNVTAVWVRYSGTNFIVQAKTKPFGGSWQVSPDNLSASGRNAFLPQIAVNAAGNATAVWQRSDGTNNIIQAKTKPFGGSWQNIPDDISATGQDAFLPQIAVDAAGNATAVWQRSDGTNVIVQATTKAFGKSWQENPDDLSAAGQDALEPQIAMDAAGNATAVWAINSRTSGFVESSTQYATPSVTSVMPTGGSTAGGTSVTIAGNFLLGVTAVNFGSVPATSFTIVSPTEIIAIAPAGSLGTVDIQVEAAGGSSPITDADRYQYCAAPSITSVVPTGGPTAGGTSVIITGTTFVGVTAVNFGSVPATSFTVVSPIEIIAIAPAGSPGIVDIQVEAAGGFSPITDADRYQYNSSSAPRPPRHFRGTNKKRHHCHERKYVLRSTWKASPSTDTSAYRLYKHKKIIATIPSNSKRSFKTHLIWKHSWKKFSITAVTANNAESVHMKLKIEH